MVRKSAQDHLDILEKMHGKKYSLASLYDVQPTLAFEWIIQELPNDY